MLLNFKDNEDIFSICEILRNLFLIRLTAAPPAARNIGKPSSYFSPSLFNAPPISFDCRSVKTLSFS